MAHSRHHKSQIGSFCISHFGILSGNNILCSQLFPPAVDMQGRTHPISGYRLVHWSPDLKPGPSNHMDLSSRDSVLTVAAVLSYFTARRSASTMKALSFCSLHLTTILFMIFRTPLSSQPPTTLPHKLLENSVVCVGWVVSCCFP